MTTTNPALPEVPNETMVKHVVTVDVSAACAIDHPLTIVATVFLPTPERLQASGGVVFALPGGGYSRNYFDVNIPGHEGYSQARHHVDRGWPFVAVDHLGVGDSTPEICDRLTIEDIAAANDYAVRRISALLSQGEAVNGYPAMEIHRRIGIGQSMGGGVTAIMAARHRTYDAIAVLGYSAIHTVLPLPQAGETDTVAERMNFSRHHELDELPDDAATRLPPIFYPFYWDDVPSDIIDLDTRGGFPIRTWAPEFGSTTLPHCVAGMLSEGFIREEAAAIDVPVFLGFGCRDVAPDPRAEPAAYARASNITLTIVDDMAHMHNFAGTRTQLWDRLTGWYSTVPQNP